MRLRALVRNQRYKNSNNCRISELLEFAQRRLTSFQISILFLTRLSCHSLFRMLSVVLGFLWSRERCVFPPPTSSSHAQRRKPFDCRRLLARLVKKYVLIQIGMILWPRFYFESAAEQGQGSKLTFSPLAKFCYFFHYQTAKTTSKFFPNVWETWMILTRKRLPVDIFLTCRLSKSLAFC